MASRSQVSVRTIWTVALHVLLLLVTLSVLRRAHTILGWIAIALVIALALAPIVSWLERRGFRRGLAVLAVLLAGLGVIVGSLATVIPVFIEQARSLISSAPEMLERLRDTALFESLDNRFHVVDRAKEAITADAAAALEYLMAVVRTVFTGALAAVTIAALCAFMLLFGPRLVHGTLELIEPEQRERFAQIAARIRHAVGGYVGGALIIAAIGGVVTTIALLIIGVPYFLALGLSMMFLGLIPYLGAIVGGVLIVGTTFLSSGTTAGIIALAVVLGYQQVENHVLQPVVQRRTINMNPLVIVIAMLVGTSLLGILGTVLALPVAGAIQVVVLDVAERRKARWAAETPSETPNDQCTA